jgi:ActR/RegA family two-component response regulator
VRLLIVDDDATFREELGDLLRDDHHEVSTAPSVVKAVAALEQGEFDVVLTDLKMPRQSGMELLREARQRWPRTFVVMVTGFATVETALEAMKLGAFDYIRKPFQIDQVRETLRLVEQEREYDAPADGHRDPAREAAMLAASGKHEVLLEGDPSARPAPHLHVEPLDPRDLSALEGRVDGFVTAHPNAAVVLANVERLLEVHRLEDVVAVLGRIRARLSGHGPLRVGFNPRKVLPAAAAALGSAVAAESTHETLEALANPIRRSVLFRLAQGPGSFREAMTAAGLDDSPKMAFHVRKLVESGLVLHEGESYRLTGRGKASVELLTDAAFLPPAGDEENLAFAKGSTGSRRPSSR